MEIWKMRIGWRIFITLLKKIPGRAPFVEPAEDRPPAFQHLIRVNHDTAGDTYRCFLPDLTGFVFVCCAVSNRQWS
jgi:hypothetical protein